MLILKILILSFLWFGCTEQMSSREPLGFFREEKSNSEYDKERKENLYYFYKKDGLIYGKLIGLDDPIDSNKLRNCGYCSFPPEVLPGYDVIQNLKFESGVYKGTMYDVYNRKWFDLRLHLSEPDILNLRIYAYVPIFGKNITWKSGESAYLSLIKERTEIEPEKTPKNLYALVLGDTDNGKISFFPGIRPDDFEGAGGIWFTKNGNRIEGYREIKKDMEILGDSLLVFYKKK